MNKQHTGRETLMQGGNYQKNREGGVPELARQPRIDFAGRCNCPQAAHPLIAPLWEDQKHPLYLPAPPSSLLTLQPSIFCLTLGCSWLCEGRWCGMVGGFLPRGRGQDSCLVSEGPWSALKLLENGCATSLCSLYYSLPVCGWLNTACVPENWVCIFMLIKKKKKRHLTLHTMSKFRLRAASLGCFTDKQVQVGDKQISQPQVFFRFVCVRERETMSINWAMMGNDKSSLVSLMVSLCSQFWWKLWITQIKVKKWVMLE